MSSKLKRMIAALAALAALALGGSAIAGATNDGSSSRHQSATEESHPGQAADRDNVRDENGKDDATERSEKGEKDDADEQGEKEDEQGDKPESEDDAAAQAAACAKAGIDLAADNIDYDDETGTCKLDSGENDDE